MKVVLAEVAVWLASEEMDSWYEAVVAVITSKVLLMVSNDSTVRFVS